jgi:hypothetical protein
MKIEAKYASLDILIDFEVLKIRWSGGEKKILSLEPGTYIVTQARIEERQIVDWKVFMVPHDRVVELQ